MREIKFRAWDKENKRMYIPSVVDSNQPMMTWLGGFGDHSLINLVVEWKNDSAYENSVAYFEPFANFWINLNCTKIIGNVYENSDLLSINPK